MLRGRDLELLAVGDAHRRDRDLAHPIVGQTEHRGLEHRGMRLERLLHLGRVHRVAAVLDDFLLTAHEHHRAERSAAGEITGAQPTVVGHRLGRGLGRAPVAADHAGALDPQLPDGAGQHVVAMLVDHPHPVAGQAHAERVPEPQAEQRRRDLGRDTAGRLDHAVTLGEHGLAHGPDDGQGDRCAHLLEAARRPPAA